jgi:adenosylcobinamide-GDP ribazoletransferase
MKDSRIGTYGALALILSVTIRIASLSILIRELPPTSAALTFVAIAVLSRTLMVWHWSFLPSARNEGVAAAAGKPDPDGVRTGYGLGATITAALCLLSLPFHAWFVAVFLAIAATVLFTRHVRRRIDGHTGDTIGASQQVCEIGFLLALAMIV